MATKTYYLSGKTKWCRPTYADTKYHPEGIYSVNVYLDEPSQVRFKESGIQSKRRSDEDGDFWKFTRNHVTLFGKEVKEFGPPKVVGPDGQPFTENIGNGSTITIKVEVFDTKKGKGHRLDTVRVDEWVEYVKEAENKSEDSPKSNAPVNGLPF